jgi:membrane-associated PAP2 superfamily phosphatase
MSYSKSLLYCLFLWAITIVFIHYNGLDIKFQSLFFDSHLKTWLVDSQDMDLKFIFYKFPKICIVIYGIALIFKLAYLFFNNQDTLLQKKLLFLILALILIPLTVAILKHYSPVVCPTRVNIFGGDREHVSPLDFLFNSTISFNGSGKCFPAGHASGGFALISLFFVMPSKRKKYLALAFSLTLGTIMGFYQIAKGVHYLSDTITTLTIAFVISLSLSRLFKIDS